MVFILRFFISVFPPVFNRKKAFDTTVIKKNASAAAEQRKKLFIRKNEEKNVTFCLMKKNTLNLIKKGEKTLFV